jgi:medium-chain acyl-[acyl-carrier-protein] hydrolase
VTGAGAVPLLVRLGSRSAPRRRLFCMPYAGGGVAPYRLWFKSLPEDVEVQAVQLPGREARINESPLHSMAALTDLVRPAIEAASDLPYAIFGHSMGAILAFEVAAALEASSSRAPSHLFVSARRSPADPDPDPPLHVLPEAQFLDEMQRRYAAIPDEVRREPELLALLLPAVRSDIRAVETYAYAPGRSVRCPVSVYGGIDDRHPQPAQLAGWARILDRTPHIRPFPGGHFYLHTQGPDLLEDMMSRWDAPVPAEVPS